MCVGCILLFWENDFFFWKVYCNTGEEKVKALGSKKTSTT